jgi:putative transcriptional regulator
MNSLKGHLLIASPDLLTPFFSRTVILMLEHNEDGALGIVLNRPTEATITEVAEKVLDEPFEWDKALGLGGPVPGPLMVIHTIEDLADQEVLPGVYSSVDADKVREVIRRKADPSLIVANYSGWGPGQLEGEFGVDSWLTLPASAEHVFWDGEAGELWETVVKAVNARSLADFLGIRDVPPDPSLN